MAATDITTIDTRVKGVNQDTNYVKQNSYLIDTEENSGLLTTATHKLVKLPKGELVSGLKLVVLKSAASEGNATVQFKLNINGTSEATATATAIANLAAGDILNLPVSGIKGYDADYETTVEMVVGTAALTAFKFLLYVETIPVHEFLNRG